MKEKLYQLQSLEWLEENAYKDLDGDWWIRKEAYKSHEKAGMEMYDDSELLYEPNAGALLTQAEYLKESEQSYFDWAIRIVYTRQSHPEYFL